MVMFLRFCLLMLSMAGYAFYFTEKFRIRMEFVPALVCAWISNLLFLAGILNILPETVILLFAGGFLLPCLYLQSRPCTGTRSFRTGTRSFRTGTRSFRTGTWSFRTGTWSFRTGRRSLVLCAAFLCISVYFFQLVRNVHVTSYDNFSHWATVVKDMLLENRMPNFEDTVIRFQSYPLGSSLFIYYICRIVGAAEGCMLWAQLLLLLSFLFCMTAFVRKQSWYFQVPVLILSGMWALTVNNSIYELRVDTLLPLAGIAAFTMIFAYKDEPDKALYASAGIFILLINIKNSGIFFYAVCILFLAAHTWKKCRQQKLHFFCAGLLAPLFTMFLWKKHVAFAFAEGMDSKHSMNLAHFGEMAAKKSGDDRIKIGQLILERFSKIDSTEVRMMLLLSVFLLVMAALLYRRGQVKKMLGILAADLACLAAYTVSLYGMYVFSMPMGESAHLASYDRYMLSVLIFIYGITAVMTMDAIQDAAGISDVENAGLVDVSGDERIADAQYSEMKQIHLVSGFAAAAGIFLAAALVWQVRLRIPLLYENPDYEKTKRFRLQELMKSDGIQEGDSCLIYCNGSDDDKRYLFYLTRYELWTNEILAVREEELEEEKQNITDYDHLIVWDSDERMDQWLCENGLGQYQGMEKIGIDVKESLGN